MENESSIKELIRSSLEQVRTIIDADTIVGKQIVTPSGTVIIPISKVSMGFASGGLDLPTKITSADGKKNFGGGGGTGVSVTPVGFLTVTPDGVVDMIPMTTESLTPVEQVAELIYNAPDIIGRIKNILENGYPDTIKKDEPRSTELEDAYREKLAQEAAEAAEMADLSEDVMDEAEQILFEDDEELTKADRKRLKREEKERKKQEKLEKKALKKAQKEAENEAELTEAMQAIEAANAAEAEAAQAAEDATDGAVAEVTGEPVAEAKKENVVVAQVEEVVPVPHNKRGKISEKTIEKGNIR